MRVLPSTGTSGNKSAARPSMANAKSRAPPIALMNFIPTLPSEVQTVSVQLNEYRLISGHSVNAGKP